MLPDEEYYENRKKLTAAIDRIIAASGSNEGVDEAIESFKTDFPSGTTERMIFTVGELSGMRRGQR